MSKSKGNVRTPDEYVEEYGADTLRLFMLFLGPFSEGAEFSEAPIIGVSRFLDRLWRFMTDFNSESVPVAPGLDAGQGTEETRLETVMAETISKVEAELEALRFNTAIAHLMSALNE